MGSAGSVGAVAADRLRRAELDHGPRDGGTHAEHGVLGFLVGWFANVFVFTRELDMEAMLPKAPMPMIRASLLLLYSLSIVATGNSRVAIHDLVHRAAPWREAMEERYRLIRETRGRGETTLNLARLPDRPRIFGPEPDDITADPAHWSNACFASFFDVPSVRLEDRTAGR